MRLETIEDAAKMFEAQRNPELAKRMRERECGDCRACCTLKSIKDLDPVKPAGEACSLLCASGCSIHEAKPATCRQYFCGYRIGLGDEGSRPDRCGALADVETVDDRGKPKLALHIIAMGRYKSVPIKRVIRDMNRMVRSPHSRDKKQTLWVAFVDPRIDEDGGQLKFVSHKSDIERGLLLHSASGTTGWNGGTR